MESSEGRHPGYQASVERRFLVAHDDPIDGFFSIDPICSREKMLQYIFGSYHKGLLPLIQVRFILALDFALLYRQAVRLERGGLFYPGA
jgi:hypothetical protein